MKKKDSQLRRKDSRLRRKLAFWVCSQACNTTSSTAIFSTAVGISVLIMLRLQVRARFCTGGPDVVFDFKTMYENTLKIALNSTCMKDLNENVLPYVYLALF